MQATVLSKTGRMPTREAAEQQYRNEEAQLSNLRQGKYDYRSASDMLENLARVKSGAFARGDEFEQILASKFAQKMVGQMTGGMFGIAPTPPIVVKIDGSPVARAAANASAHSTRPGGV